MDFIGRFSDDERFVVDSIRAEKKKYLLRASKSKTGSIEKYGWHHESFDTPGPKKNRTAISKDVIQAMLEAIPRLSSDSLSPQSKRFIDRRRTIMMRLLEMTGARIEELAQIRVSQWLDAISKSKSDSKSGTLAESIFSALKNARTYMSRDIWAAFTNVLESSAPMNPLSSLWVDFLDKDKNVNFCPVMSR